MKIRKRSSIRGDAIIESIVAMFVIFLVLAGLLQIFYFAIGTMVTEYAALRGVRSFIVGFNESLVRREVKVNAIAASGQLVYPTIDQESYEKFDTEKSYINGYLSGWRWMEYEHWEGKSGQDFGGFQGLNTAYTTKLSHTYSTTGSLATVKTHFSNYLLLLLQSARGNAHGKTLWSAKYVPSQGNEVETAAHSDVTNAFFGDINLTGKASMRDNAPLFLDTGGSNP